VEETLREENPEDVVEEEQNEYGENDF
jgi:hypothetical protein